MTSPIEKPAAAGLPRATKDRIATIRYIDSRIAARLRVARIEAGLSQEKTAEALGLSFQQVQKYESGKNRISPGKLAVLAALYGKPIASFYHELEQPPATTSRDLVERVLESRTGRRMVLGFLGCGDDDQVVAADVVERFACRAARQLAQAAE
uniref:Helix-turn-helix domain protein n=1 Tax=Rhodopseudomonas palustris (strain DX-1) TaxID=652103 RepID=E6VFJ4_RHOPX